MFAFLSVHFFTMLPPPEYGYTVRETEIWRAIHLLLAIEYGSQYNSKDHEAFVHSCVSEEVLDPKHRADKDRILQLFGHLIAGSLQDQQDKEKAQREITEWRKSGLKQVWKPDFESHLQGIQDSERRHYEQQWDELHYEKWLTKRKAQQSAGTGSASDDSPAKGKGTGKGKGKAWKGKGAPGSSMQPRDRHWGAAQSSNSGWSSSSGVGCDTGQGGTGPPLGVGSPGESHEPGDAATADGANCAGAGGCSSSSAGGGGGESHAPYADWSTATTVDTSSPVSSVSSSSISTRCSTSNGSIVAGSNSTNPSSATISPRVPISDSGNTGATNSTSLAHGGAGVMSGPVTQEPTAHSHDDLPTPVSSLHEPPGTDPASWVLPTPDELQRPSAQPTAFNLLNQPYPSIDDYLHTHATLMRADLLLPLLGAIHHVRTSGHDPARRARSPMYRHVREEGVYFGHTHVSRALSFVPPPDVQWDAGQWLKYGNLLCLSADGFATCHFAMVIGGRGDHLRHGLVFVRFLRPGAHEQWQAQCRAGAETVMLESPAFYMAYEPVLATLASVAARVTPARPAHAILRLLARLQPPQWPPYIAAYVRAKAGRALWDPRRPPLEWAQELVTRVVLPRCTDQGLALDASQWDALVMAFANNVALIQGPPGTGKSFLAGLVLWTLLRVLEPEAPAGDGPASPTEMRGIDADIRAVRDALEERKQAVSRLQVQCEGRPEAAEAELRAASHAEAALFKRLKELHLAKAQVLQRCARDAPASAPIVVVTYKNFSLDQLLVQCLAFEQSVVRVGTRSENEELEPYNLRHALRAYRLARGGLGARASHRQDELERVKQLVRANNELAEAEEGRLRASVFLQEASDAQVTEMMSGAGYQCPTRPVYDLMTAEEQRDLQEQIDLWMGVGVQPNAAPVPVPPAAPPHVTPPEAAAGPAADSTEHIRQIMHNMTMDGPSEWGDSSPVLQGLYRRIRHRHQRLAARRRQAAPPAAAAAAAAEEQGPDPEEMRRHMLPDVLDDFEEAQFLLVDQLGLHGPEADIALLSNSIDQAPERDAPPFDDEAFGVQCPGPTDRELGLERVEAVLHMPLKDRRALACVWKWRHGQRLRTALADAIPRYEAVLQEDKALADRDKVQVLRRARIIGMTSTGVAMNMHLLEQVRPKIVILEEAAELLEGQLLASLPSSVEHVILFGDHHQLRPNVENRELETAPYNLAVSCFERLAAMPDVTFPWKRMLTKQHRMHPDISKLVNPFYGDRLVDAEGVKDRRIVQKPHVGCEIPSEAVAGVQGRMLFVQIADGYETKARFSYSIYNRREAQYIAYFVRYLVVVCGVEVDDLVVVCMYRGQVGAVRSELLALGLPIYAQWGGLCPIKVTTCDAFQGSERSIVLLSTVRSGVRDIGFLGASNRICVALSRSRHALYIFGDEGSLRFHSRWAEILRSVTRKAYVPLTCVKPGHTEVILRPACPSEFPTQSPPCAMPMDPPCDHVFPCGHRCKQKYCHWAQEHEGVDLCEDCAR